MTLKTISMSVQASFHIKIPLTLMLKFSRVGVRSETWLWETLKKHFKLKKLLKVNKC